MQRVAWIASVGDEQSDSRSIRKGLTQMDTPPIAGCLPHRICRIVGVGCNWERVKRLLSFALVLVALCGVMPANAPSSVYAQTASNSYVVESITHLTTNGGRVAWSRDGQWIYYDRREPSGYFELFRMRPNGTADECLTCGRTDLPSRHKGNPTVHPSGRYVVFQVEKQVHAAPPPGTTTIPGGGAYNDLWVMDVASENHRVWRLTNVRANEFSGSLHAHFSHDGRKLLWTDLEGLGGVFFDSRLAVADFRVSLIGGAYLENFRYFNPGPQPIFLETHGWGPKDRWVYFACTPVAGMTDENMDICRMDFDDPANVKRITRSSGLNGEPGEWDEHAHFSPTFDAFSWMSSQGYGTVPGTMYREWLKTDLWLKPIALGSRPQRLTFYNDPTHPHYAGERVVVADHAWHPDGRAIAIYLQFFESGRHEIVVLRFVSPTPN
jgi:hypothetical protein